MTMDVMSLNQLQVPQNYVGQGREAKDAEAKITFLSHVLSTVLEPVVKEGPYNNPDSGLFFNMWFDEITKSPEMIKDFGFGEELDG